MPQMQLCIHDNYNTADNNEKITFMSPTIFWSHIFSPSFNRRNSKASWNAFLQNKKNFVLVEDELMITWGQRLVDNSH